MRFLHERGPLSDALAAAQGPADPAPLAAAGRAAGRSTRSSIVAAGRRRALAPARASRRSRSSTWCRRSRASSTLGGTQGRRAAVRGRAVRVDRPDPRQDARGGDREGASPARRSARSSSRPTSTQKLAGHARPRRRRAARRSRSTTTPRTRSSASFVEATIKSTLAEANAALSDEVLKEVAPSYLERDRHRREGRRCRSSASVNILGLRNARRRSSTAAHRGAAARTRRSGRRSSRSSRFARLAADNLDLSKPILASIGTPVAGQADDRQGRPARRSSAFAVAVAVTVSLMFVTLLLAAGMLALEREENAFGRLVRGLVSPHRRCWSRRSGWPALCAFAVCAADARRPRRCSSGSTGAASRCGWSRSPFGALGVRRAWAWRSAALTREVRAASLLAFVLSLPIAVLALVPSAARSAEGLYDVIKVDLGAVPVQARARRRSTRRISGGALAHARCCTSPSLDARLRRASRALSLRRFA